MVATYKKTSGDGDGATVKKMPPPADREDDPAAKAGGQAVLKRLCAEGRPLARAKFDVCDAAGSVVASGETDWQGLVKREVRVPEGKYTVQVTDVAPPDNDVPPAPAGAGASAKTGAEYLAWAEKAVAYTQKVIKFGPANNLPYRLKMTADWANYGGAILPDEGAVIGGFYGFWVPAGIYIIRMLDPNPNGRDVPGDIEQFDKDAKKYGLGNCGEHAAVTFVYLRDAGVRPLEYIQRPKHAFVVIGRPASTSFDEPATWGPDAVVADAWARGLAPAAYIVNGPGALDALHQGGASKYRLD